MTRNFTGLFPLFISSRKTIPTYDFVRFLQRLDQPAEFLFLD